ncbi:O-antigen ligase family protein [Dactylosporangium darangshiense]|uniref:O-antigen ligase-related domain-containing protein n=1 Tax=Dactylosporangium darangshiense TaxID=579108 RepID=A0ABP8D7Z1_9ACTN
MADLPALQAIPARPDTTGGSSAPALTLLAAAIAGVVAQGGFYTPGRILVSALALLAFALAVPWRRPFDRDLRGVGIAAAAIAAWALLRAATAGGLADAAGICLALMTLLAGITAARRARPADLALGLTGLGVLVALTAWAGVAWRIGRWAVLVESTLWRGASTLTYPNAAAAILAVAGLLALALLLAEPGSWVRALALYLILAGLGAALSRAGLLAFGAGALVFMVFAPHRLAGREPDASGAQGNRARLARQRRVLRHLVPAALGAAVATAALVPSFPANAAPEPLLAVGGLIAGGLIALVRPLFGVALAAGGGAAALALSPSTLDTVLRRRFTVASQGRAGALRSALDQAGEHPLLGSGPGQARYFWFDFEGKLVVSRWVHNEYLQWLVDLGAVGLAALLGLVVALVMLVRRGRTENPLWTGAVAAIAAVAVHSAFDFLWELAVVPLIVGVLAGMAGPPHGEENTPPSQNGEAQ